MERRQNKNLALFQENQGSMPCFQNRRVNNYLMLIQLHSGTILVLQEPVFPWEFTQGERISRKAGWYHGGQEHETMCLTSCWSWKFGRLKDLAFATRRWTRRLCTQCVSCGSFRYNNSLTCAPMGVWTDPLISFYLHYYPSQFLNRYTTIMGLNLKHGWKEQLPIPSTFIIAQDSLTAFFISTLTTTIIAYPKSFRMVHHVINKTFVLFTE
jgi:hypothetical protein